MVEEFAWQPDRPMVDPHLQHSVSLLPKATAFSDDFDLVAVWIGDEEELREGGAIMLEITQRPRRQLLSLETGVLSLNIVHDHGKMSVSIADRIRLFAIKIHCELDFER
jgi:hypothetical protein